MITDMEACDQRTFYTSDILDRLAPSEKAAASIALTRAVKSGRVRRIDRGRYVINCETEIKPEPVIVRASSVEADRYKRLADLHLEIAEIYEEMAKDAP